MKNARENSYSNLLSLFIVAMVAIVVMSLSSCGSRSIEQVHADNVAAYNKAKMKLDSTEFAIRMNYIRNRK